MGSVAAPALPTASGREGFSVGAVGNADWHPRKASMPGGSDSPPSEKTGHTPEFHSRMIQELAHVGASGADEHPTCTCQLLVTLVEDEMEEKQY